jgi:4-amino-4-deoxy-L-arabinose transferase-like glycosyltransferase
MKIRWNQFLPFVWIVVSALAIGALIQFAAGGLGFEELTGDQGDYHRLAERFKQTGNFGSPGELAYRAPLYPIFLGHVYSRLGTHMAVARAVGWVLAAAMVLLAAMIAYKLSESLKAAWLAAGLVCLNSYWWLNQTELMPENLAAVLLAGAIWCWPNFSSRTRAISRRLQKHGGWVAGSGFLFGLAMLVKPIFLPIYLCLPIAAVVWSPKGQRQSQVAFALIFLLISLIPIATWTQRNYRQLKQWVPITTGSGEVFWGSHAPETLATAKGSWTLQPLPEASLSELEGVEEPEREVRLSQVKWDAGWSSLANANFMDVGLHFIAKPLRLWSPSVFFGGQGGWWLIKAPLILWNAAVLIGFFYQLRKEYTIRPLAIALVISLTLTAIVFWGTIRFQYVLLPLIAALTAQVGYRYLPDWAIFKPPRSTRRHSQPFRESKFG